MSFKTIPGVVGKIYVREQRQGDPKKHDCSDCGFCQQCNDDKCRLCRSQACGSATAVTGGSDT